MRHLLRLHDLPLGELDDLFAVSTAYLQGRSPTTAGAACLFFPPTSLRTRVSFERGANLMGLQTVSFIPETLEKPEALKDVAGYLASWINVAVVRHPEIGILDGLADSNELPIVNAMTDANHPCEVLSDLFAISRSRDPFSLRYLFVGADGNVGRAWLEGAQAFGLDLTQCCPASNAMPGTQWTDDLWTAVAESDVILTDGPGADEAALAPFRISGELLDRAPYGAQFAPCPPFERGRELTADAIEHPAFVGYSFKSSLLPLQQAVLARSLQIA